MYLDCKLSGKYYKSVEGSGHDCLLPLSGTKNYF